MLKIAIHRDNNFASSLMESGRQGGGLTEIPAESKYFETRVRLNQVGEQFEAAVCGGIVYKEDFVWPAETNQDRRQPIIEGQNRMLLVMDRYYDGKHSHLNSLSMNTLPGSFDITERTPFQVTAAAAEYDPITHLPASILLDNVRSAYNVGSFFRTADAAGIERLYLSGITAGPPHKGIAKTALGAEETVPWERIADPLACVDALRARHVEIAAIETSTLAVDLFEWRPNFPVCLIFGHEVDGLAAELAARADRHVRIPMLGMKHSLNVATAGGIVMYELLRKYRLFFRPNS
jgi:23S rRNA (guanosine2251-2'-O)-methyltransferase